MNKIRYFIFLIPVLLSFTGLNARDLTNREVLSRVSSKVSGEFLSRIGFSMESADYEFDGTALICGGSYRIETADVTVISDGRTRWIYTRSSDEAVILNENRESPDLIENPFLVFSDLSGHYDFSPDRKAVREGDFYKIDFVPQNPKSPCRKVCLKADPAFVPVSISFVAADTEYDIRIVSFRTSDVPDPDLFVFVPGENTFVTDLR